MPVPCSLNYLLLYCIRSKRASLLSKATLFSVTMQVLQCSCIRKVLLACPLLEQLTVELGHRGTYASGVANWAAVLVRAIQDAQRGNALASALRRLELRCRSCVTLDLM